MNLLIPPTALQRAASSTNVCLACRRALFATKRRTFSRAAAAPLRWPAGLQPHSLDPEHIPTGAPPPRNVGARQPVALSGDVLSKTRPARTAREMGRSGEGEAQNGLGTTIQNGERDGDAESQTSKSQSAASAAEKEASSKPVANSTTPPTSEPTSASQNTRSPRPSESSSKPLRPSRLRSPRKAALQLSPTAVSHIRALLSQPIPQLIKVGVRNRGCSGLAYHLEYVDKKGAFDEVVEQDGVQVLIDSKALFSIIGSEMDWVEDKLSARFVFRNPNIKEQCGCGESFSVA